MSKTAMATIIDKMQEANDNFPAMGFDEEFVRGFNKGFQMAIFITKQVGIPLEKQQIIDARIPVTGLNHASPTDDNSLQEAEDYYNQTYQ